MIATLKKRRAVMDDGGGEKVDLSEFIFGVIEVLAFVMTIFAIVRYAWMLSR